MRKLTCMLLLFLSLLPIHFSYADDPQLICFLSGGTHVAAFVDNGDDVGQASFWLYEKAPGGEFEQIQWHIVSYPYNYVFVNNPVTPGYEYKVTFPVLSLECSLTAPVPTPTYTFTPTSTPTPTPPAMSLT